LRKSKLDQGDFDALLLLLQKHIHLVTKEKYDKKMAIAEDILRNIDITDSPFLALALAFNCSIWSNDGHFQQQNKVVVYTSKDLMKNIR